MNGNIDYLILYISVYRNSHSAIRIPQSALHNMQYAPMETGTKTHAMDKWKEV